MNWKAWLGLQAQRPLPSFWVNYLEANATKLPKNTLLSDIPFVVFDTETTGLDTQKSKLLSIGAVLVQHQTIYVNEQLDLLVEQEWMGTEQGISIHGILPNASQKGLPTALALERFLAFIDNKVLVGQHVSFDIGMVNQALKDFSNGKGLVNPVLDTCTLAYRLENIFTPPLILDKEKYTLDMLAQKYQIPMHDRHTAPGDALITAILLLKLLAQWEEKGVKTLGRLLRYG